MRSLFQGAQEFDTAKSWRETQVAIAKHRHTLRWRKVAVAVGAAIAVVGGGAAAVVSTLPVTDSSGVECRAVADDGAAIPGTFGSQATPSDGAAEPVTPVEFCTTLWRTGLLRPGVEGVVSPEPGSDPNTAGPYPVPSLVACVDQADGHSVVVVGTSPAACASAGLAGLAR